MMQGEVMNPGGYAMTVGFTVAHGLFREPMDGVSDLLQIGIASVQGCSIRGLQPTYNFGDPDATERHTPTDLCTSWQMFEERARALGTHARAAVAFRGDIEAIADPSLTLETGGIGGSSIK
jgi:hypothetical protein